MQCFLATTSRQPDGQLRFVHVGIGPPWHADRSPPTSRCGKDVRRWRQHRLRRRSAQPPLRGTPTPPPHLGHASSAAPIPAAQLPAQRAKLRRLTADPVPYCRSYSSRCIAGTEIAAPIESSRVVRLRALRKVFGASRFGLESDLECKPVRRPEGGQSRAGTCEPPPHLVDVIVLFQFPSEVQPLNVRHLKTRTSTEAEFAPSEPE